MHHRALSISVWLRDTHDGLFGPFPVTARELPNVDELGNWGTAINPPTTYTTLTFQPRPPLFVTSQTECHLCPIPTLAGPTTFTSPEAAAKGILGMVGCISAYTMVVGELGESVIVRSCPGLLLRSS